LALSGSLDQRLILWDVETGNPLRRLTSHPGGVLTVAFGPDGSLLASGGADGEILLWDMETGKLLNRLDGHDAEVLKVVFAPDGKTLLSVANDGTVREWQIIPSQEAMLAWVKANRYVPELTCEQRLQYGAQTLCDEGGPASPVSR
jgi:WD40 repeat protein